MTVALALCAGAFLEKDALREKIDMLRQQNLNLLAHLKNYSDIIFPQLLHLEAVELQRLRNISTKVKDKVQVN